MVSSALIKRCALFYMIAYSSSYAVQQKSVIDSIIISSIPEKGMIVNNNKLNYMLRYHVRVLNTTNEAVDLKKGCYYASDYSGKNRFKPKIFSPELLGVINSGPEGKPLEGEIEFISKNKDVYSTVYVGWDEKCQ